MDRQAHREDLSKDESIELVLKLQRPAKTSRTSSRPPSTVGAHRHGQASGKPLSGLAAQREGDRVGEHVQA